MVIELDFQGQSKSSSMGPSDGGNGLLSKTAHFLRILQIESDFVYGPVLLYEHLKSNGPLVGSVLSSYQL